MSANIFLTERERIILESAVVGIAGAGGLGSNCAAHLVRAGIKHLIIADFDVVTDSNLNRQYYFRDQIGRKKVEALRENLESIEPELNLKMVEVRITSENLAEIFGGCDVIVEAFDTVEAKQMLIQNTLMWKTPVIGVSGIAGWGHSAEITVKKLGANLIIIGDADRGVNDARKLFPASPRVGIAAAMEANTVVAILLGVKI